MNRLTAPVAEFFRGVRMLGRGFAWWRQRPGLMAAALLPALIVGAVVLTGLIVLASNLAALTSGLTPFADDWAPVWSTILRIGVGIALFMGASVAAVTTFTALCLLVGDPFYTRIWRSVEASYGPVPEAKYSFWLTVVDSLWLMVRGLGIAVGSLLLGFVPLIGGVLAAVVAASLSGWVLSDELTSRALSARGLDPRQRRRLRGNARARVWGFGVATHLLVLIPLGAIVTIPAAVAGSTMLSHQLLDD